MTDPKESSSSSSSTAPMGAAGGDVASLLDVADARAAEIAHLAARLVEVSGRAQVAALNVSLEIARDGGARAETESAFAEEVRRLAERVEAVAQRLPRIVGRLEAAHREVRDRLGAPGARSAAATAPEAGDEG